MCCNGVLKIIGDGKKNWHNKNTNNNHVSITTVRVINAASNNGLLVFWQIEKWDFESIVHTKILVKHYSLPAGSMVLMNDSAYMDNSSWVKVVETITPGVQNMPVICNNPEWFTCVMLDVFKSHVNTDQPLEAWQKNCHQVTKEKASMLHVNQAYDQC